MRLKTHQYIAETAIILIEDITGITFNHKLVKLGACAPDIALNRRLKLHTPALAGIEYEKMLGKFENGNRSNGFLSYILGAYSHYVADAFCFAHNCYVADLKKHVQYEVLLQELIYSIPLPIDIVDVALEKSKSLRHGTVLEYMQNENNQYRKLMEGKIDWEEMAGIDLTLAIINCTTLMLQFVYEVQAQQMLVPAV